MKSLEEIKNSTIFNSDSIEIVSKNVFKKFDYQKLILSEIREITFNYYGCTKTIKNKLMMSILSGKLFLDETEYSGVEFLDNSFKFAHWFRVQFFFFNSIPHKLLLLIIIVLFYFT